MYLAGPFSVGHAHIHTHRIEARASDPSDYGKKGAGTALGEPPMFDGHTGFALRRGRTTPSDS